MTAPLRLVDTGLSPARRNVAMTAALCELHRGGGIPDTLRLHRYPRSVLLGRHQGLDAVDMAACAGIEIARRVTGGGAVCMGPGVLAWDLVIARRGAPKDLSATVCGAVAAALRGLGFPARFRPPGDVTVGGRKVSGSAGWQDGGSLALQGSVLVEADLDEMARLLRLPGGLVATLGPAAPALDSVADALVAAIAAALGRPVRPGAMSARETAFADRLLAGEIGAEAFVAGDVPA